MHPTLKWLLLCRVGELQPGLTTAKSKVHPSSIPILTENPESVITMHHPFCLFTPKAVQCKHTEYWNFAECQEEKWCLDPKEEEHVTLHGAYLGKNNYSYWERNFRSFKCCMLQVVCFQSRLSSTGLALWGNFGQGLLWEAFVWTSLYEQWRQAFEWKLYTESWETLPHQKPQNKPLPLGLLSRSSMELKASQLGHKAKSISTFLSQENHFPVVPFISALLQHSPPSSCKQTTLTLAS